MVHSSSSTRQKWTFSSVFKSLGWGRQQERLGDVWDSSSALQAFESREMRSTGGGGPLRLAFRNATPLPLVLCWISESGVPHHFRTVEPCTSPESELITKSDHIECSSVHHAFSLSLFDKDEHESNGNDEEKAKTLDPRTIIGGYRPACTSLVGSDNPIHLVTISRKRKFNCCAAPWGIKKGHYESNDFEYCVSVKEGRCDPTPIDTSKKHYEECIMGGWPVRLEPNWSNGDKKLEQKLKKDLEVVCKHLPQHAQEALKANTPLWINKILQYGPAACPITGRGMCFHPGADWLVANGMNPEKAQCVELYRSSEYLKDSNHWGPGGLLLHELCHAYHYKCLEQGYDNKEIWDCYHKAMEEGLYDCVKVHGSQGPTAKAYACTDAMEYFAELSVAFLGGRSKRKEYNKWFPFNRHQLKQHDPRAYKLLQRLWQVSIEEDTISDDEEEHAEEPLGDVWDSSTASKAFVAGELRSKEEDGRPVRIAFRNGTPTTLSLCWMCEDGKPHGFYKLEPCSSSSSKDHNNLLITKSDHIEHSHVNHAFTISIRSDTDSSSSSSDEESGDESSTSSVSSAGDRELDPEKIIGGYRPSCTFIESNDNDGSDSEIDSDDESDDEEGGIHLVTITRKQKDGPWGLFKGPQFDWFVSVKKGQFCPTPIDTSNKHYEESVLGGWPVRLEPNWSDGDKELEGRLANDLKAASKCLPAHARSALLDATPLWINRSQEYGPAVCPVQGDGMCYHPDADWLIENGMSPKKQGCIELYNALEYMDDCDHWGPGGLLLHEISHAYHHKCVKNGYDNQEVSDCYEKAMKEGLYDCVKVHGSQGPTAKAYACTDAEEYFAELSVAFLGGTSKRKEFNKWFPFNRHQLKKHDPRAYKLLQRLWKVDVDKSTKTR